MKNKVTSIESVKKGKGLYQGLRRRFKRVKLKRTYELVHESYLHLYVRIFPPILNWLTISMLCASSETTCCTGIHWIPIMKFSAWPKTCLHSTTGQRSNRTSAKIKRVPRNFLCLGSCLSVIMQTKREQQSRRPWKQSLTPWNPSTKNGLTIGRINRSFG